STSPVRMYSSLGDVSDLVEVEDLPQTIKNNETFIDSFGRVYFTRSNDNVLVTIVYNGEYKLKYTFDSDTDYSMFNTIEAYYINVDGNNPQIYMNLSDNNYLSDMLHDSPKAFTPHVIWDLNTNDLKVVKEYKAQVYIKQNNEGVL